MGWFLTILIVGILVYFFFNVGKRRQQRDPYSTNGQTKRPQAKGRKGRYGKWIGGGLGWAFGGPIGAILGFAFGSMFPVQVAERLTLQL